jgi:hypothetical protein
MNDKTDKKTGKSPRHPIFFHGWWAWASYLLHFVTLDVVMAQFLGGINNMWFFTIGFLLMLMLWDGVGYIINMWYWGPYFKHHKLPKLPKRNKCGETVCETAPACQLTYNQKVANDIQYHSDEKHYRIGVLGTGFLLVCYGLFLSQNGGQQTFQPLPLVPNHDDIMAFVIVKGFHVMVMGLCGIVIFTCFDTQWCFMYSYWTNMNLFQKEKLQRKATQEGKPHEDLYIEKEKHRKLAQDLYNYDQV